MNLLYFIRLLLKNWLLIGGLALLMGIIVFMYTRNQPETYTSSTTVYTGLATGFDVESGSAARIDLFATNASFDNLVNIIRSRQTQEETAIRLMAQHLSLIRPDPRICTQETRNNLIKDIPPEIRILVILENPLFKTGEDLTVSDKQQEKPIDPDNKTPEKAPQAATQIKPERVTERIEKFRSIPVYYIVKAGDSPSSIARAHNLDTDQLLSLNPEVSLPLFGGQRLVVNYLQESFWKDTVIINNLPAGSGASDPDALPAAPAVHNTPDYERRMDSIAITFNKTFTSALQKMEAFENSVQNLLIYKDLNQDNYLFSTLQSNNPYYGTAKLNGIRVSRVQGSDLLRLTYDSDDPGVCMQTLKLITDVFIRKYQGITATQTTMVSEYFRERRDQAKGRLDTLETEYLNFMKKNRIINYPEQTKFIAEQNESLDRDIYTEMSSLSSAKAALHFIEENLDENSQLTLENTAILEKREALYRINSMLAMKEMETNPDIESIARLKTDASRIERELENHVNQAFALGRTPEGISVKDILPEWLTKAIAVEESRARYETLSLRKGKFLTKYDTFAPLGSQIRKMEREMNLVEQEYLNHVHNLNLTVQKQKGVEQSNIQVVDPPLFPLKPNPSKRMVFVMMAIMAGALMTAGFIILMEFLDSSIKMPERAVENTGLGLIGVFPRIPAKPDPNIDYNQVTSRSIDIITQKIKLEELHQKTRGEIPFLLFVISTREKEGKTFIASKMVERLRVSGLKVLFVKPFEKVKKPEFKEHFQQFQDVPVAWDFEYEIPPNLMGVKSINELLRNYTLMVRGYKMIVVELPALLMNEYPAALTSAGHMTILVCRASRSWNKADSDVKDLYRSQLKHPVVCLLNGCHVDHTETVIGEIPRHRSRIRQAVKKMINLEFRTSKTL